MFYIEQTHPFVEFSPVFVEHAHHELSFSTQVINELPTFFFLAFFYFLPTGRPYFLIPSQPETNLQRSPPLWMSPNVHLEKFPDRCHGLSWHEREALGV